MNKELAKKYLRNLLFVTILFLVINTLITTGVLNRYYTTILVLIMIGIIAAVSLNLASGMLGQLVLGHAAFMGIGAYGAAITGKALIETGMSNLFVFIISAIVG